MKPILLWLSLVAATACILLLVMSYASKRRVPFETFEEDDEIGGADVTVYLFHAKWCGHCVRYLEGGAFDRFAGKYASPSSPQVVVKFRKVDVDQHKALVDKYGVRSFPTLLAVVKGQKMPFGGDRESEADLKTFVNRAVTHFVSSSNKQGT
jgi:thiol-disulfide isomerase/thioredoxin